MSIDVKVIILFIILSLVVLALGVYLGMLYSRIRYQKKQTQKNEEMREQQKKERVAFVNDSIFIIGKATLQGQCELSEACVRISALLKNYPDLLALEDLGSLRDMSKELEAFDYLDARKALSKQERFNQDKKRFEIEKKYED